MNPEQRAQLESIRDQMIGDNIEEAAVVEEEPIVELEEPEEEVEKLEEELDTTKETAGEKEEAIEYFNDLPAALNLEPDEFYKLKLKTSDGKEYTWSEIKDNMQAIASTREALEQKEAEIRQAEQQIQQQILTANNFTGPQSEKVQKIQQQVAGLEQAYAHFTELLNKQADANDTEGLVRTQAELTKIQNLYGSLRSEHEQAINEQQQIQSQYFNQYRQQQFQELQKLVPEFAKPDSRQKVQTELREYLINTGIPEQALNNLVDAKQVAIAYKAMLWDKHQKDVQTTVKKVSASKLKRVVSGAHSEPSTLKAEQAEAAVKRARETRSETDRRAAFRAVATRAGIL
jgi:hypothetical protein